MSNSSSITASSTSTSSNIPHYGAFPPNGGTSNHDLGFPASSHHFPPATSRSNSISPRRQYTPNSSPSPHMNPNQSPPGLNGSHNPGSMSGSPPNSNNSSGNGGNVPFHPYMSSEGTNLQHSRGHMVNGHMKTEQDVSNSNEYLPPPHSRPGLQTRYSGELKGPDGDSSIMPQSYNPSQQYYQTSNYGNGPYSSYAQSAPPGDGYGETTDSYRRSFDPYQSSYGQGYDRPDYNRDYQQQSQSLGSNCGDKGKDGMLDSPDGKMGGPQRRSPENGGRRPSFSSSDDLNAFDSTMGAGSYPISSTDNSGSVSGVSKKDSYSPGDSNDEKNNNHPNNLDYGESDRSKMGRNLDNSFLTSGPSPNSSTGSGNQECGSENNQMSDKKKGNGERANSKSPTGPNGTKSVEPTEKKPKKRKNLNKKVAKSGFKERENNFPPLNTESNSEKDINMLLLNDEGFKEEPKSQEDDNNDDDNSSQATIKDKTTLSPLHDDEGSSTGSCSKKLKRENSVFSDNHNNGSDENTMDEPDDEKQSIASSVDKKEVPMVECGCFPADEVHSEPGPFYTHLGAAHSLPDLRNSIEMRTGFRGAQIRIEKVIYTGKEGKTKHGCPLSKWVSLKLNNNTTLNHFYRIAKKYPYGSIRLSVFWRQFIVHFRLISVNHNALHRAANQLGFFPLLRSRRLSQVITNGSALCCTC